MKMKYDIDLFSLNAMAFILILVVAADLMWKPMLTNFEGWVLISMSFSLNGLHRVIKILEK